MNKYIKRIVESIFDDEDFDNIEDQTADELTHTISSQYNIKLKDPHDAEVTDLLVLYNEKYYAISYTTSYSLINSELYEIVGICVTKAYTIDEDAHFIYTKYLKENPKNKGILMYHNDAKDIVKNMAKLDTASQNAKEPWHLPSIDELREIPKNEKLKNILYLEIFPDMSFGSTVLWTNIENIWHKILVVSPFGSDRAIKWIGNDRKHAAIPFITF